MGKDKDKMNDNKDKDKMNDSKDKDKMNDNKDNKDKDKMNDNKDKDKMNDNKDNTNKDKVNDNKDTDFTGPFRACGGNGGCTAQEFCGITCWTGRCGSDGSVEQNTKGNFCQPCVK